MLYEMDCWPIKNSHISKMKVPDIRMLRWMYDHIRRDKIRNNEIRFKVGVAFMVDKMSKAILR